MRCTEKILKLLSEDICELIDLPLTIIYFVHRTILSTKNFLIILMLKMPSRTHFDPQDFYQRGIRTKEVGRCHK